MAEHEQRSRNNPHFFVFAAIGWYGPLVSRIGAEVREFQSASSAYARYARTDFENFPRPIGALDHDKLTILGRSYGRYLKMAEQHFTVICYAVHVSTLYQKDDTSFLHLIAWSANEYECSWWLKEPFLNPKAYLSVTQDWGAIFSGS